ncbi:hypothetical protein [Methylobacterium sp. SyP6R]|uniref:hypothetical protein n=1 Tax=Methylobacterium sp. SyP6R TaxID=2718876 RepID=UPI001F2659D0|nr:hypothetical protein [Methylobacterium sp. SyP6R]MCF4130053.1 hypothetical protein [Methylobacterium sp. SyP6R]
MTYGELQAVFQLAVGLNIGVYALKDISFSTTSMASKDYNYVRLSIDVRAAKLKRIESSPERKEYDDLLSMINEKIVDRWAKSKKFNESWGEFIRYSTVATGITAFIALYYLFMTSYKYTNHAPGFIKFMAYLVYLPGIMTIGFHLLVRRLNKSFEAEQESIDQEILKIDRFVVNKSE